MTIDLKQFFGNVRAQSQLDLEKLGIPGVSGPAPQQLWDQFARVTQAPGQAPMYGAPVGNNVRSIQSANNTAGSGFNGAAWGPWEHRDLDLEMARVSEAVYHNAPAGPWRPMSPQEISNLGIDPNALNAPQNGMESSLYTDDNGRYALAFRGNDGDPGDVDAVARQLVGLQSGQVDSALNAANQVKGALGDQVIFTGHSLGGGLAAIAASRTGTTAVTFAAQGVHDGYLGADPVMARSNAAAGQVRTYNVRQDPLLLGQSFLPWVPQFGVERTLSDPRFDIGNVAASHNMANLIDAMNQQL